MATWFLQAILIRFCGNWVEGTRNNAGMGELTFVECRNPFTPVAFSRIVASEKSLSELVPAVLETMRSLEFG